MSHRLLPCCCFNDTATTEIYTLSLHDALPICGRDPTAHPRARGLATSARRRQLLAQREHRREEVAVALDALEDLTGLEDEPRSEEHTSELQSRQYLVCRLLLEKKKCGCHRRQF